MKKLKTISILTLSITLGMLPLSGCSTTTSDSGTTGNSSGKPFIYNCASTPKTLDPTLGEALDGINIDANLFEGLCQTNDQGNPIPGVASSWDVSDDELEYTFHLRQDAKWSDGTPVTSEDFLYSWKRAVDPATASTYAYLFYTIKNAEAANTGKCSVDEIGVSAPDDYTLVVDLENPTSYFLSLLSLAVFSPEKESVVEANPDDWANNADTLISNGKYKMTEIVPKDHYTLEANPNYWDASSVKLPEFEVTMVSQDTTAYASLLAGQIDVQENVPASEIQAGIADGFVRQYDNFGTYYYYLNLDEESCSQLDPAASTALQDPRVREALNLGIDRNKVVSVTNGGQIPAYSIVPPGYTEPDGNDFNGKQYFPPEGDVDKAKELLAEAGYPDGQGFPTLEITYNNGGVHQDVAQVVQSMWKDNLGINVDFQAEEWQAVQSDRANGNYEISRGGWNCDYLDPMAMLEIFTTNSGTNFSRYSNPDYDAAIASAKAEADPQARCDIMHQAEDIIMNDLPIVPLYYYNFNKGVQPYVQGLKVTPLGYMYFDQVTLDAH